jgi:hypothetical protein
MNVAQLIRLDEARRQARTARQRGDAAAGEREDQLTDQLFTGLVQAMRRTESELQAVRSRARHPFAR